MADIVDQANEVSDLLTQSAISNRVKPMPVTGFCYNCVEPAPGLFCDSFCREDYEKRITAMKRRGA